MLFSLPRPLQVVLNPTTNGPKQAEFHRMVVPKSSQDTELKIKLAVRMDKPPNMKHSGWVCGVMRFSQGFQIMNGYQSPSDNQGLHQINHLKPPVRLFKESCASYFCQLCFSTNSHLKEKKQKTRLLHLSHRHESLAIYLWMNEGHVSIQCQEKESAWIRLKLQQWTSTVCLYS